MATNKSTKPADDLKELSGLKRLREPFAAHQISKLPKPTKNQTEEVRADYKKGIRCEVCGGWHHPKVVHLDYVGHAALTDRLLDCDVNWNWHPIAFDENNAPLIDHHGGMWISLTVCGVTRLGYGHPDGKTGGNAYKETIGDALRNAAMRFGAALDLWHKGDLHQDDEESEEETTKPKPTPEQQKTIDFIASVKGEIKGVPQAIDVAAVIHKHIEEINKLSDEQRKHVNDFAAKHKAYLEQGTA